MSSFPDPFSMPFPNGVFADTGEPLPVMKRQDLQGFAIQEAEPDHRKLEEQQQAQLKLHASSPSYGAVSEVEPDDLSQSGWGIIFSAGSDPAIRAALEPLLRLRANQAAKLFRVFDGAEGYFPGDTVSDWLARRGVRMDVVEPLNGVPYYLLLVGSPQEIPLEFQYLLDIHWAVGRVYFETPAEYRCYADSVNAYETEAHVQSARETAVFATQNEGDKATQMFTNQVAIPLASPGQLRGAIGHSQGFALRTVFGDDATKEALTDILGGKAGSPALLFTGSHGMLFRPDDPRQKDHQGAIICQDWPGSGPVSRSQAFSASDIPSDARIHGMIHIFFACFSNGWPEYDTFASRKDARRIAPAAMFSKLPQALLTHPNGGALATLGHVDRAFAYSFVSPRGVPQIQSFRSVIAGLLMGRRIGHATDEFNVRWASLSAELADMVRASEYRRTSDAELASLWVARDDARNYLIFGDPAVRLRVEEMARGGC